MKRIIRELFGLCFSAVVTVGVYSVPLLSLIGAAEPTLTVVEEPPDYFAEVRIPADVLLTTDEAADPAPTAPSAPAEPAAPAEPVAPAPPAVPRTLTRAPTVPSAAKPKARQPVRAEEPDTIARKKPEGSTRARSARAEGTGGLIVRAQSVSKAMKKVYKKKGRCKAEHDQVATAGRGEWVVDRELVEYYTASIARFNTLGWSKKYKEDGEKGWQISGFGCNSPLYFGGLRRGDVIQSVNGRKTNNVFQVLAAYTTQKKKDHFEVVILRNGKTLRYRYRLT